MTRPEMIPRLTDLFGPSARRIFDGRGSSGPVIVHGRSARLPDLFTSGAYSSLEQATERHREVVVGGGASKRQIAIRVQTETPKDLFDAGLSVSVERLAATSPEAAAWVEEVTSELGLPEGKLRLMAFASPKGDDSGLSVHYDPTDNVIIQLKGRKRLGYAEGIVRFPSAQWNPGFPMTEGNVADFRGKPPPRPPRLRDAILRPGSVAYIPAGCWHATRALDDSYSVSLVFEWPRAVDVLVDRLRAELLSSAEWRRPLYGGWGDDPQAAMEHLRGLLSRLQDDIAVLTPAKLLSCNAQAAAQGAHVGAPLRFLRVPTMLVKIRPGAGREAPSVVEVFSRRGTSRSTLELDSPATLTAVQWVANRRGIFELEEVRRAFPRSGTPNLLRLLFALRAAGLLQLVQFSGQARRRATARRTG